MLANGTQLALNSCCDWRHFFFDDTDFKVQRDYDLDAYAVKGDGVRNFV